MQSRYIYSQIYEQQAPKEQPDSLQWPSLVEQIAILIDWLPKFSKNAKNFVPIET